MYHKAFMTLATTAALTLPAIAADETEATPATLQVTAPQIQQLLAGNTITGTWSGSNYTQYYGTDGSTVYIPEGGQPSPGKWRVKEETNEYDSWWESTGWTPYTVVMTNDGFAWVNGDKLEPFDVLTGKQVEY